MVQVKWAIFKGRWVNWSNVHTYNCMLQWSQLKSLGLLKELKWPLLSGYWIVEVTFDWDRHTCILYNTGLCKMFNNCWLSVLDRRLDTLYSMHLMGCKIFANENSRFSFLVNIVTMSVDFYTIKIVNHDFCYNFYLSYVGSLSLSMCLR